MLECPEEDPRAIDAVLHYIYTGTYNDLHAKEDRELSLISRITSNLTENGNVSSNVVSKPRARLSTEELHVQVNLLAWKWNILQLHQISLQLFANCLAKPSFIGPDDQPSDDILNALKLVYQSCPATNTPLRVLATRFCIDHYNDGDDPATGMTKAIAGKLKQLGRKHEPVAFRIGSSILETFPQREGTPDRTDKVKPKMKTAHELMVQLAERWAERKTCFMCGLRFNVRFLTGFCDMELDYCCWLSCEGCNNEGLSPGTVYAST